MSHDLTRWQNSFQSIFYYQAWRYCHVIYLLSEILLSTNWSSSNYCQFCGLVNFLAWFFYDISRFDGVFPLIYISIKKDFLYDICVSQRSNLFVNHWLIKVWYNTLEHFVLLGYIKLLMELLNFYFQLAK